jgi:hypothetical protein
MLEKLLRVWLHQAAVAPMQAINSGKVKARGKVSEGMLLLKQFPLVTPPLPPPFTVTNNTLVQ